MLYLSPRKYRSGGWGVDLSGLEDVELRAILHRASAMVNKHCAVPTMPVEHDFRGGVIIDELGHWDMGYPMRPPMRRFYPYHRPLRSVESMRIMVTNTQGIQFSTPELYVGDSFIEVVSMAMTSYGLFGAAIIPNIGLSHPQVRLSYTYGRTIPVLNEELEVTDGFTYSAQNQWWDTNVTPTVRIDGVEAATGFTIDYDEGEVTLDEATATTRVHVDYYHRLPSAIAEATGSIATEVLAERELTRKGLAGLVSLTVGEVSIRRSVPRNPTAVPVGINERAASLLEPYRFITARGGSY
jgi:hypothetical protein